MCDTYSVNESQQVYQSCYSVFKQIHRTSVHKHSDVYYLRVSLTDQAQRIVQRPAVYRIRVLVQESDGAQPRCSVPQGTRHGRGETLSSHASDLAANAHASNPTVKRGVLGPAYPAAENMGMINAVIRYGHTMFHPSSLSRA
jgi:hypothetical protein